MLHIVERVMAQHDPRLVALGVLLCGFTSWTAVTLLSRARVGKGRAAHLWMLTVAAVFGAGVWATHFVAMLAYRLGFPIDYDIFRTIASIVMAVAISWAGFMLVMRGIAVAGGAIVGAGIGAMQYIGTSALRGTFDVVLDTRYAVASAAIGVVFCALAAKAGITIRNYRGRVAAAVLFTVGICAVYFAGMSGVTFVLDPTAAVDASEFAPRTLAVAVSAVAVLVVALGLVGAQLDRYLAFRRSGEAERLRAYVVELEQAKSRLEAMSSDLTVALKEAAAGSEAKSAFLAAMSHELRTPLNAVMGFSDLLMRETFGPLGDPRNKEYVADINRSGLHLLSLINDILDLTRLEAGQASLREDFAIVGEIVEEACKTVELQARDAGIDLSSHVSAGLPSLFADARRVRQILLNLLSNAVKFTPCGGRIAVRACLVPQGLSLAVCDTGIGIAEADIPRALERFGQVDGTLARKYEGMGLGLPLAKGFAELHGATLSIESAIEFGTTVTVVFPTSRVGEFQARAAV
ncbi:MAG: hypothetical protein HY243_06430 [Proteobacteria bacterium]|nr:hypothetical protein [Pseudomonadota bacterium]